MPCHRGRASFRKRAGDSDIAKITIAVVVLAPVAPLQFYFSIFCDRLTMSLPHSAPNSSKNHYCNTKAVRKPLLSLGCLYRLYTRGSAETLKRCHKPSSRKKRRACCCSCCTRRWFLQLSQCPFPVLSERPL